MTYNCDIHGKLESDWCEECEKIVDCDCLNQTSTRCKDLSYDCDDGERFVTIRIYHCETCGKIGYIE